MFFFIRVNRCDQNKSKDLLQKSPNVFCNIVKWCKQRVKRSVAQESNGVSKRVQRCRCRTLKRSDMRDLLTRLQRGPKVFCKTVKRFKQKSPNDAVCKRVKRSDMRHFWTSVWTHSHFDSFAKQPFCKRVLSNWATRPADSWGSFAEETYSFKEPTNRSHPIQIR